MLTRALRAARLDGEIYKAIVDEPQSIIDALFIVIVVAVSFGVGMRDQPIKDLQDSQASLILMAFSTILVGWVLWATVIYLVGTWALGGKATHRTLLRATGVAYGPGVLMVLIGVPFVGDGFFAASLVWLLATVTVAVRETQGFTMRRAAMSTVTGWILAHWILRVLILQPA